MCAWVEGGHLMKPGFFQCPGYHSERGMQGPPRTALGITYKRSTSQDKKVKLPNQVQILISPLFLCFIPEGSENITQKMRWMQDIRAKANSIPCTQRPTIKALPGKGEKTDL